VADDGDPAHARFKALYDQHYPAVLRYAARRVGAEAARDIAADTFLTAWRRLDRVPAAQPLPWLYATACRCLANELRGPDRRERLAARIRAEAAGGPDPAGPEPSEWVAGRLAVLGALNTLRPKDQEALRLILWEQLDGQRLHRDRRGQRPHDAERGTHHQQRRCPLESRHAASRPGLRCTRGTQLR
jgi:RNA polymerase sigma-70 factor (ECF subfamily)